jgi:hypothetical protein
MNYKAPYMPTPDQIRRMCQQIQAEWTPEQEQKRQCKPDDTIREYTLHIGSKADDHSGGEL